jgi:glycosyltransferase involved in cell wall biosynthesis
VRIVHVAPTPFGQAGLLGGGERYPLALTRALARRVDCRLVTFGPAAREHLDPSGLRVRVLHRLVLLRGHPAQPVAPQLAWALDGDVVHTHQTRSAPSRLAAVVAAVRRTPLVTTDHGLGGGGWLGLLPALVDRFLTVSAYSAQTMGAAPWKTRVIYGGADPERFRPDPEDRRAGALFVGRLTPHKGVDRLIRAMPDGAALTVAGSEGHDPRPPERDYPRLLRRLAAHRDVRFTGPVPDAELPLLYRRAAVFVLPSVERTCYGQHIAISELLGLSVLEAMASGTPVVASRIGGLPEVVRDGETGFLVPPGDGAELRDRVARLLADPALARRMGERARAVVREGFTWEACAERCLAAYEELVPSGAA